MSYSYNKPSLEYKCNIIDSFIYLIEYDECKLDDYPFQSNFTRDDVDVISEKIKKMENIDDEMYDEINTELDVINKDLDAYFLKVVQDDKSNDTKFIEILTKFIIDIDDEFGKVNFKRPKSNIKYCDNIIDCMKETIQSVIESDYQDDSDDEFDVLGNVKSHIIAPKD